MTIDYCKCGAIATKYCLDCLKPVCEACSEMVNALDQQYVCRWHATKRREESFAMSARWHGPAWAKKELARRAQVALR